MTQRPHGADSPESVQMPASAFSIRPAREADIGVVLRMIRALAEFERLSHLVVATEADLRTALFAPAPAAEVLVASDGPEVAGFALYFHNFSTFLGRRGVWLEDLWVEPAHRRRGCAQALLRTLAAIAVERGCGRFEWAVLDWNHAAIDFYRALGATVLPDWRIVRVVGQELRQLAEPRPSCKLGPGSNGTTLRLTRSGSTR